MGTPKKEYLSDSYVHKNLLLLMQLFLRIVDRLITGLLSSSSSAWCVEVLPILDTGWSLWFVWSVGDEEIVSGTSSSRVDWSDICSTDPQARTFRLKNFRVISSADLFLFSEVNPDLTFRCFCLAVMLGCSRSRDCLSYERRSTYIRNQSCWSSVHWKGTIYRLQNKQIEVPISAER